MSAITRGQGVSRSGDDSARDLVTAWEEYRMTVENPGGPFIICYDGSEAAERAIHVAPVLVGRGRAARVLYAYKPTDTAEALDAPAIVMGTRGASGIKSAVLGSVSRDVVNAYHRPVVLV